MPDTETNRYLDPTFHRGHYVRGDTLELENKLADTTPLEADADYTLELAIRAELSGMQPENLGPAPIIPRREDKETVRIYARVRALEHANARLRRRIPRLRLAL